uniref:Uncharacterized protein n=1 Tax=Arundo donax TaxID=35708 RepID=A0A0A9AC28_ARUDO
MMVMHTLILSCWSRTCYSMVASSIFLFGCFLYLCISIHYKPLCDECSSIYLNSDLTYILLYIWPQNPVCITPRNTSVKKI